MKTLLFLATASLLIFLRDLHAAERTPAEAFGGPRCLSIVRHADKVVVTRIKTDFQIFRKSGDYEIAGGSVTLNQKDQELLAATLTDPSIYSDDRKGCMPRPGLKFRFYQGDKSLDVLVCLECAMFFVKRNGEFVGDQNCDTAVPVLLDLALRLFPKDAAFLEMKKEETREKIFDSQVSPTDGAKLVVLTLTSGSQGEEICILRSSSDASIWIYEEKRGVYKPDPNDKSLQELIQSILKFHAPDAN